MTAAISPRHRPHHLPGGRGAWPVVRASLALLALAGLIFALPYALLRWGSWPISGLPSANELGDLPGTLVSDSALFGIFTLAAWFVWAAVIVSVVLEVIAQVRGHDVLVPGMRPIQHAVRTLVAWLVISVSAGGPLAGALGKPAPEPVVVVHRGSPVVALTPSTPAEVTAEATSVARSETAVSWATVVVTPGDSAWALAEAHYGSGGSWRRLWNDNRDREQPDGTRWETAAQPVEPGWLLRVRAAARPDEAPPHDQVEPEPRPEVSKPTTVVVQDGDNFWRIADQQVSEALGRQAADGEIAPYWERLIDTNRLRLLPPHDPNLIYAGQAFVLPPVAAPAPAVLPPTPPASTESPDTESPPTECDNPPSAPVDALPTPKPDGSDRIDQRPDAQEETDDDSYATSYDHLVELAAKVGAGAALASVTLAALARRRRSRRRSLLPGSSPGPRPAEDMETELALAAADTNALPRAWAAARAFGEALKEEPDLPNVLGIVVPVDGDVTLHLSAPALAAAPFEPGSRDDRWLFRGDSIGGEGDPESVGPVLETLVAIGRMDDGASVFIDLESLGVVHIDGPEEPSLDLARSIVTELSLQPLDHYLDITAVGLSGPATSQQGLVELDELDESTTRRLEQVAADTAGLLVRTGSPSTPAARATGQARDGLVPTVVAVAKEVDPVLLNRLTERATPGGRGIAVVALGPIDAPATPVEITEDGELHLRHLGITCRPVGLPADGLHRIDDLLQHEPETVEAPPVVVVETPSEPPSADNKDLEPERQWDFCVRIFAGCRVENRQGALISFKYGENPAVQSRNATRGPELLAYLALRPDRSATTDEIRDHLWWGKPVGRHSIDNLLSATRKVLGGADYLSHAEGDSTRRRYHLAPTVVTDVELLRDSLARVEREASDPLEAAAILQQELGGIERSAFASGYLGEGLADWAAAYRITDDVEEPVVAAALRIVDLHRDQEPDHVKAALEGLDSALRACETNEPLIRAAMTLEASLGSRPNVTSRYNALITRLGTDDFEPEAETLQLYDELVAAPQG